MPAVRRGAWWSLAGVALLALLTILVSLRVGWLMRADAWTTTHLHDHATGGGAARFFSDVSRAGDPLVAGLLLGVVGAGYAVRRQWRLALWPAAAALTTYAAYSLTKIGVARPRPDIANQVDGWSFPSGHAAMIGCAMAVLVMTLLRGRGARWLRSASIAACVAIGLLVGVSRLFVAAHFPTDVIAGWLLGGLVAYFVAAALRVVIVSVGPPVPLPARPGRVDVPSVAVIVNPIRIDSDQFRALVSDTARRSGWDEPLWFETTVDDAGASMARAAIAAGAEVVVAAGGDGTVRVVTAEMAGTGIPVAVIPAGTGNLLARNLGIPLGTEPALDVVFSGRDRRVDLVRIKGDDITPTRFAVMAGMGLDAAIMSGTGDSLKQRVGWAAYAVALVRHLRYPAVRVAISVDGAEPEHRRARTVVVGNVGSLTAGIPLLPDARIDDGLLDVVVIAPRRLVDWVSLLWRVLARHRRTDERLDRFTGHSVVVTASSPTPRQLDGDPMGAGTELHAEVEPGALLVRVPR